VLNAAVQALTGLLRVSMVCEVQRNRLYRSDTPPDLFANAYFGTGALAAGSCCRSRSPSARLATAPGW
jgi:hypothetical protein